jgi:hypothetical protein
VAKTIMTAFSGSEGDRKSDGSTHNAIHHFHDHRRFLRQTQATGVGSMVDAVIVPTYRPATFLETAADVAVGSANRLVVLCSGEAKACEVLETVRPAGVAVTAIDIPDAFEHPLLHFTTSTPAFRQRSPTKVPRDLSLKRNIGLLLARMLGWQKIFFLDDDIREIRADDVRRASAALDRHPVCSFLVTERESDSTPDNSAVCHARRLAGHRQAVFASGSALGIASERRLSYFPDIYNEDWFFLLRHIHWVRRPGIAKVGEVSQRPYDPFEAERSRYEEFGDVLAEGLLARRHLHRYGWQTRRYWQSFLDARGTLLAGLLRDLPSSEVGQKGEAARRSVTAAQEQLQTISAETCVEFLRCFHEDVAKWSKRLDGLPRFEEVRTAVEHLALDQPEDAANEASPPRAESLGRPPSA